MVSLLTHVTVIMMCYFTIHCTVLYLLVGHLSKEFYIVKDVILIVALDRIYFVRMMSFFQSYPMVH